MITDVTSPNHGPRKPERGQAPMIDTLVIHYTGMMPTLRALDWGYRRGPQHPRQKKSRH